MFKPTFSYYFIIDKYHNLLVESIEPVVCAIDENTESSRKYLPKITSQIRSKLTNSFKDIFQFNLNYHHTFSQVEVKFEIFLLENEIKPEFSPFSWIAINKLTESLYLSFDSPTENGLDEMIECSLREIFDIYCSEILQGYHLIPNYFEVWHFCNNKHDANHLAQLVREGTKRATASLFDVYQAEQEPLPTIGAHSVIIDFDGVPQAIIQTTQVDIVAFEAVTAEFARIEGEGDKSLEYWRRIHIEFFTEEAEIFHLSFTPQSLVICEQFKVVKELNFY